MPKTPTELDAIRAERNNALENLRLHDPILWCIVTQQRGARAIAEVLAWPIDQVEARLLYLHTKRTIIKKKYLSGVVYTLQKDQRDLIRLRRRAQNIRYTNRRQWKEEETASE